jgi:hypothetical protein
MPRLSDVPAGSLGASAMAGTPPAGATSSGERGEVETRRKYGCLGRLPRSLFPTVEMSL